MKIFNLLDAFILSCFQEAADVIQSWTGINNFAVARIFGYLFMFLAGVKFAIGKSSAILMFDAGMMTLLFFEVFVGERSVRAIGSLTTKNILTVKSVFFRLLFIGLFFAKIPILMSLYTPGARLLFLQNICVIMCLYLAACTPKPPSKSKLRKMLESLGTAVQSLVPQPEPCPVRVRS